MHRARHLVRTTRRRSDRSGCTHGRRQSQPAADTLRPSVRVTRRRLLIGAGALAGASAAAACEASTQPGSRGQKQPGRLCTTTARPGAFWNVAATANLDPGYAAYVARLEQALGRRFAGIRKNYFPSPGQPQVSPEVSADYRAGRRWVYVNGKPDPIPGDGAHLQWASVSAGAYDSVFMALFRAIRGDRRWSPANPYHYSFHHEQEVEREGGGALAGTPQEYRFAFAHVRALMDAAGAHVGVGGNMLMCWTPSWLQLFHDGDSSWPGYPYDATNCDPSSPAAARPYDLLGCDVYRSRGVGLSADAMWRPVHEWARRRGVPFFGGEVGVATTGSNAGDVVGYLRDLQGLLAGWGVGPVPGGCLALCWTTRVARGGDYRLDADPAVLDEYRRFGALPTFGGCAAA